MARIVFHQGRPKRSGRAHHQVSPPSPPAPSRLPQLGWLARGVLGVAARTSQGFQSPHFRRLS
eukprot:scaffold48644_cov31-Tisochrysis_lutea.AAC.2